MKSCVGGVRVFMMAYLAIYFVLLEDISFWMIFYFRVCILGGYILQFKLFHWNTCFTGRHILLDDSPYRRTPL